MPKRPVINQINGAYVKSSSFTFHNTYQCDGQRANVKYKQLLAFESHRLLRHHRNELFDLVFLHLHPTIHNSLFCNKTTQLVLFADFLFRMLLNEFILRCVN